MAKVEIVKFETSVDKLCADWVLEVAKQLTDVREAVGKRTEALGKAIEKLPAPQKVTDDELNELPARINEIVKENSVRLKGVIEMKVDMRIDGKAKKIEYRGYGYKGKLAGL